MKSPESPGLVACLGNTGTLAKRGHDVAAFGKEELDITDGDLVPASSSRAAPRANCALCCLQDQVDQAETEQETAFAINERGTENVAVAASKLNIPMLFVNTDYVFDGSNKEPTIQN